MTSDVNMRHHVQVACLKIFVRKLSPVASLAETARSLHKLHASQNLKLIFTSVFVFVVSVLCFANSLHGDFVHDDIVAITTNPDVIGRTSLLDVFKHDFWGKAMSDMDSHKSYRPLTILTFRLNMYLSSETWGFHLVNIVLHAIVVQLIIFIVRTEFHFNLRDTTMVALLFATHPIHCEAVANIVGRADVLCCIFFLLSIIFFTRSLKCPSFNKDMVLSLVACQISATLALLSKETGITVLGACIVYFFVTLRKRLKLPFKHGKRNMDCGALRIWLYGPLVSVVITMIVTLWLRILILGGTLPYFTKQDNPASFSPSLVTRFLTYSYLPAFNARLLLAPITLSYDWQMGSIPLLTTISDIRNLSTIVLAITLATIIWKLIRQMTSFHVEDNHTKCVAFSLCVLILPYIPASNVFVTVGFVVAERVLYIPSFGIILLISSGLKRLADSNRFSKLSHLTRLALFALIVIFAAKTFRQNQVWLSREALFESGLKSVPQNAKAHYNYANLQKDLGNSALAVKHYRIALSLWPEYASAHNNLGALLCELSDTHEAEQHFKAAIYINPLHTRAHFNLANIYRSRQKRDENITENVIQPDLSNYESSILIKLNVTLPSRIQVIANFTKSCRFQHCEIHEFTLYKEW